MHIAGTPILPLLFTVFQVCPCCSARRRCSPPSRPSHRSSLSVCLGTILPGKTSQTNGHKRYVSRFHSSAHRSFSQALNHINVFLFTPALLFSKVAFFLTLGTIHRQSLSRPFPDTCLRETSRAMGHPTLLCLHFGTLWPRRKPPCTHMAAESIAEVCQSLTRVFAPFTRGAGTSPPQHPCS